MKRFVEGQDRSQLILLPDCLDDYVGEDNPVRIVDAFIDELDLAVLGFAGVVPEVTGRPSTAEDLPLRLSQPRGSRAGGSNGKRSAISS
jgi:transposase